MFVTAVTFGNLAPHMDVGMSGWEAFETFFRNVKANRGVTVMYKGGASESFRVGRAEYDPPTKKIFAHMIGI